MTDIRRPLFSFVPPRGARAGDAAPTVEVLSHAARFLRDRPPSADVIILESADALTPYRAEIEALAASSSDTNSQYDYYALAAAMEHLRGGSDVRLALLWSDASERSDRELIGAVPYHVSRGRFGLPLPVWRVWYHLHSYICTPVLKRGHERQALRRFLALADHSGAAAIEFPMFAADSAFADALADVGAQQARRIEETDRHVRAFLQSSLAEEDYLSTHIRKKKRKEFNRLWNRLSEEGELRFAVHDGADVEGWLKRFLTLEAAGWKGKRGTALKADREQRAFFEKLCRGAQAQGKLHCTELTLDGSPIAMLSSFRAGNGLYTFKIAFDETRSRFSPGTLLMLKLIGEVLRDERTAWADSCAVPGHPMIDHIWGERREMRSVVVAGSSAFGAFAARYVARATKLAEKIRARLRKHYHAFRKEMENEQTD
ncbi:MAG: GNAT family N-acetyltransferase [Parvibaculum sp.]|nr:GNAT family N-acetyltransferase [Parvibaculum sp.]